MLLLHGGPGMNDYLETLADELDGLSTIAHYQQRGLAPSATTGERTVERHVADAVAVMDALGWETPVVIGHSWGAHLALHLAVAHPDRIGGLVMLDALGAVGDGGIAEFARALRAGLSEAAVARMAELDALDSLTAEERRERMSYLWPNYFGDPADAPPMPESEIDPGSAATWTSIKTHFGSSTLETGLPAVDAPALVIHGDRSPVPLEQAQRLVGLLPNARLVTHHGKGHWAWLEEPGFIRAQVEHFLASL